MRVNRIYFRGLKTFQCVFLLAQFSVLSHGGVENDDLIVQTEVVSQSPLVIQVELGGGCSDLSADLEFTHNWLGYETKFAAQVAVVKGLNGKLAGRFVFNRIERLPTNDQLSVRVETSCKLHQSQVIEHQISLQPELAHTTPDWAKGVVWYQVFPERFRNGNLRNDPQGWDLRQADWYSSFDQTTQEEIELAWNRRMVEARQFAYSSKRAGGAVANLVFTRRYGGDLFGVYEKLDDLWAQGYRGLYLCPVFQSRSLHKYDASDHRHIDPTLGHPGSYEDPGPGHVVLGESEHPGDETTWSWTPSDRWFVDVFLPKAKSIGFRVMLDGVWNHVGTDHFAFTDLQRNGADSEFADWFEAEFDEQGNLVAWQGWGNRLNGNLPEFQQTQTGDLVEGPKSHIMAVTRRWMDPNGDGDPSDGIDGWRLDVAGEIGRPFWKDWRALVKSLNPEALIIAEIWSDANHMLNNQGFDGQMNYPFAYPVADWLSIGDTRDDASIMSKRLEQVFYHHPQHDLVQLNLMTSHDTERLVSMMHNHSQRGYDNEADRWGQDFKYDPDSTTATDRQRALCAIAMMVASPGAMMMYNGDEFALPGADDPDNRRPIPWKYLREQSDRHGGFKEDRQPDVHLMSKSVEFNQHVSQLIRLRSDPMYSDVLRFGSAEFSWHPSHKEIAIVRRRLGDRMLEFMINPSPQLKSGVDWSPPSFGWLVDHEISENQSSHFSLQGIRVRHLIGM
jgi:cyclomaltodextrinase / maltogenic alpha-amylase / neopullulanase